MKKLKNKILVLMIITLLVLSQNVIYAAMADFTDEQADKQTKQQQENWQKEQEIKKNKSTNNYLKSLYIKEYKILPDFNKDKADYEIDKEIEDDNIEIIAEAEDEKSNITGNGKITLNSGENNLKISVTAENGEERLYFIKAIKKIKHDVRLNNLILKTNNGINIDLAPQFNMDIFEYDCNIPNYIDKIDIEAIASENDAIIETVGNEDLKEGLNVINVSVSINNDEKIIYKINVSKEKASDEYVTNNKQINILYIAIVVILFLIIVCFIYVRAKKHTKHGRH